MRTEELKKVSFKIDPLIQESIGDHNIKYVATNESVDQIVAALDPKEDDSLLAILGGGEQTLGLLERIRKGKVVGVDVQKYQVVLAAFKLKLITIFEREEYVRIMGGNNLHGNILYRNKLEENVKEVFRSWGLDINFFSFCDDFDQFLDIWWTGTKVMSFLREDEKYKKVKYNSSDIKLVHVNFSEYVTQISDQSFNLVYVSNVFDYYQKREMSVCLEEVRRSLKFGGKFYASTRTNESSSPFERDASMERMEMFKKFFQEDQESYRKGKEQELDGCLGSPGWGDFFVGTKV